jgi:hypothetical protein
MGKTREELANELVAEMDRAACSGVKESTTQPLRSVDGMETGDSRVYDACHGCRVNSPF